jgi:predicted YcjX-like family ATPase
MQDIKIFIEKGMVYMTKNVKENKIKKSLATGVALVAVISAAVPTLAGVNYTEYSSFNVNNSAIDTAVIDKTSTFNGKGGNVSVVTADEVNIVNSYIDTLVDSGITTINVRGRNIDITNLDTTNITDSMIVTVLKQKAKLVNAKETWKKAGR